MQPTIKEIPDPKESRLNDQKHAPGITHSGRVDCKLQGMYIKIDIIALEVKISTIQTKCLAEADMPVRVQKPDPRPSSLNKLSSATLYTLYR